MIDLLTKLVKKAPKKSNQGFTLIELLVAMVIATLVITPLLGFMADILNRERIEQAKATSEAEIQAAIDYIAQDLEQAVYIYNADGLEKASTDTPPGIKDQIPPSASAKGCGTETPDCTPVLVFWKREIEKKVLPFVDSTPATQDDTFVYSLVAYYLVKEDTEGGEWSDTARIARFQIKDGVVDPNDPTNADGAPKYVPDPDDLPNLKKPSPGYQEFKLTGAGSTLSDKMNLWAKKNEVYTAKADPLIDYVDKGTTDSPIQNCPTNTQRVPSATTIRGFYACVDSSNTLAQVYIRGNALARIDNTNYSYNAGNSAYFPTASVQVKGLGFLGVN